MSSKRDAEVAKLRVGMEETTRQYLEDFLNKEIYSCFREIGQSKGFSQEKILNLFYRIKEIWRLRSQFVADEGNLKVLMQNSGLEDGAQEIKVEESGSGE